MHSLNLKVSYKCSNNCSFCFASELSGLAISEAGIMKAVESGYASGARQLVISGGEPTLFPGLMERILSFAEDRGYERYIVQTNGFGLSKRGPLIDAIDSIACRKEVCVSFSLHGHNAEIHDEMSQSTGAYARLISAIKNIASTRCRIYTNTVISTLNVGHLSEIVNLMKPFRPDVMQFAMMHTTDGNPLGVGLIEASNSVKRLFSCLGVPGQGSCRDFDKQTCLRTEGIPYCLMRGMEECVGESYWPDTLDLYNKDNEYMKDFNQEDYGMRWKSPECCHCIMSSICKGIWKEHANEFSSSGIGPIV